MLMGGRWFVLVVREQEEGPGVLAFSGLLAKAVFHSLKFYDI